MSSRKGLRQRAGGKSGPVQRFDAFGQPVGRQRKERQPPADVDQVLSDWESMKALLDFDPKEVLD